MSDWTPEEQDSESDPRFSDAAPPSRREHRRSGPDQRVSSATKKQLRRTYGLTALGTLIPGAGLSMTRRRPLGIAMLAVVLIGLVALLWFVWSRGAEASVLDLGARPRLLRQVGFVLTALVLVWMGSVALTALTSKPSPLKGSQRFTLSAFTVVMCLVLAAPAALGWRYINAHTDAVERIFIGRQDPGDGTPLAAPDLRNEDPWAGTPRVNALLLGSDAGDTREGTRTDSMLIASIDTTTGNTVLFGIPRNLEKVPIPKDNPLSEIWPDGYDCGDGCLMNGIWTAAVQFAEARPELYADDPTPGPTATREVLSEVIGQPIDYTVIVNLEGFQDLVDAMGGVEIDVQERLPMGGRTTTNSQGRPMLVPGSESGYLEPGLQRLSGYQALWYARSRITTDDFSRMRRQRCVVAAVVDQVNPLTMIQRYPQIVGVAGNNITADISQEELPAWADLVRKVQGAKIESLPFTIENTDVGDPDYDKIHAMVEKAINPPPPKPASTSAPKETSIIKPTEDPADATPTDEPKDELEDVGVVC
ncbi:MAG: LCP family protein [Ornithinimicrobium sp.]